MMIRLSFRRMLTFSAALCIFLYCGEITPAKDRNPELLAVLKKLYGATSVTLMIMPWDKTFGQIDESRLPDVACVYEMRVEPGGLALRALLALFNSSFVEYQTGYQTLSQVRIGVIFKSNDDVLQTFYFEDWGGAHNIHGLTGPTRILASADFADQLRALVKFKEVKSVKSPYRQCYLS